MFSCDVLREAAISPYDSSMLTGYSARDGGSNGAAMLSNTPIRPTGRNDGEWLVEGWPANLWLFPGSQGSFPLFEKMEGSGVCY